MGFEVRVSRENSIPLIEIAGIFDESAKLPDAEDFINYTQLIIDFDGVRFINSAGIAIYLRFLQSLEEEGLEFIYRNCPKGIISQINTILGFLPEKGRVESFYLPIFCEKCQKNFDFLTETKDFEPKDIEVREVTKNINCAEMPRCKKHHSIDVIERRYFHFLTRK